MFGFLLIYESLLNLFGQFRRNDLISVQAQDPGTGGLRQRGILLCNVAFPRFAKYFPAMFFDDFFSSVSHIFVEHDHQLARPAGHAVQRTANPVSFGPGDHADRDGEASHSNPTLIKPSIGWQDGAHGRSLPW